MSWIKRLSSSLRSRRHDEDIDRELAFHLEMRTRERTSAGETPEEARRNVLERFGNLTRTKEACREHSTLVWLTGLGQDLRYAVRSLGRDLRFTVAATACLALGIGASATVFSFVNAFLLQPLPPHIVLVQRGSGRLISYPEYQDWRRFNGTFEDVFAYSPGERLAFGRESSDHVLGETVTASYFQMLGVSAAAGRMFAPGDESQPLVVLGHQLWKSRYQGNPAIVGKPVWINGKAFTVAGVASPGFLGMLSPWSTDIWITPYLHGDRQGDRRDGWLLVGARLKAGVTQRQAEIAMRILDTTLRSQHLGSQGAPGQAEREVLTVSRRAGLSGSPVWSVFIAMAALLMAVVGIIFLIACANVASLLTARALPRHREISIRLSVGASRPRIIRQLLVEGLLLALLGGAVGIGMAFAAGDGLAGLLPESISGGFRFQHGIDLHVLAFTLSLAMLSVLISGLLPAFRASQQNLAAAGRAQLGASGTPRLRKWLVIAQVAASVLVVATAGVFLRGFQKARATDPGYETERLLTVDLDLRKTEPASSAEFYSQMKNRVSELPAVVSMSLANVFPLGNTRVVTIPEVGEVATATVDPLYFRTLGIPFLRGQSHGAERDAIVINEALARRLWQRQDPIGKSIHIEGQGLRQVIAVTATGKYWSLTESPRPFLYQVSTAFHEPRLSLAIRTRGDPRDVAASVAEGIRRTAGNFLVDSIQTGRERLARWLEPQRSAAVLLSILGVTALALAITGLYALLGQLVAQRTSEIAVRVALGASPATVTWLVLRQGLRLIAAGALAGIAGAVAISHLLAGITGQGNPLDGITLIGVAVLLAIVAAIATFLPTYRAVRIEPLDALRAD